MSEILSPIHFCTNRDRGEIYYYKVEQRPEREKQTMQIIYPYEQIKALQEENERLRKEIQMLRGQAPEAPFLTLRKTNFVNKVNLITSACLSITGGKREYLKSRFRGEDYVINRQIVAWFLWRYTELTLNAIGQHLNGCDHTSVINLLHRFVDLYETDREYRQMVKKINSILTKEIKVNRHRLPSYYNIYIQP